MEDSNILYIDCCKRKKELSVAHKYLKHSAEVQSTAANKKDVSSIQKSKMCALQSHGDTQSLE